MSAVHDPFALLRARLIAATTLEEAQEAGLTIYHLIRQEVQHGGCMHCPALPLFMPAVAALVTAPAPVGSSGARGTQTPRATPINSRLHQN